MVLNVFGCWRGNHIARLVEIEPMSEAAEVKDVDDRRKDFGDRGVERKRRKEEKKAKKAEKKAKLE